MAEIPRLNGMISVLESGGTAITAFSTTDVEAALAYSASAYDGIVFEMEHGPYDNRALRDALQYMLNRRQLVQRETLAPPSRRWSASRRTAASRTSGSPSRCWTRAYTGSSGRT